MLTVVAVMKCQPGKEAQYEELMAKLVAQSRQEPGNQRYQLFRSVEDPSTFLVYEQYDDKPAFKAHAGSAHFKEVSALFKDVLEGQTEVALYQPFT